MEAHAASAGREAPPSFTILRAAHPSPKRSGHIAYQDNTSMQLQASFYSDAQVAVAGSSANMSPTSLTSAAASAHDDGGGLFVRATDSTSAHTQKPVSPTLLNTHLHDHKRLKPTSPLSNLPAASSSYLVYTPESRLFHGQCSPSSTTNCSLTSSTLMQAQHSSGEHNPFLHTHHRPGTTGGAESYVSLAASSNPTSITENHNLSVLLPLMSNHSSKSTTEQAPLLHELPNWFVNHMLGEDEAGSTARAAGPGFVPGCSHEASIANYMHVGHYNLASRSGATGTQGLISLLEHHGRPHCNVRNTACEGNPSLISLLGEKEAEQSNVKVNASILQAQVVSHPLFEHLLAAHLACLRMGTPTDQWLSAGLEAGLAQSRQQLEAKYLLLARNAPLPHDKEHLDHFMLSLILLLQTFREQLREHMQLHSAEAMSGCAEIKEAFLRVTGDTSTLNDMPCSTHTMSDDESMVEDDDNVDDETAAVADDFGQFAMHDDDMHMMVMSSSLNNNMNSDVDRRLMERVRKELKLALKQDYRSKLWDVREEIMRKRRAGKLPGSTTSLLRHWWDAHCKWPYPTEEEKQRLVQETGLELKQINNWFINQRKRNWTTNPALERADLDHVQAGSADQPQPPFGLFTKRA
ncbi:hypothetical protein GOP47_0019715 [Adiantum capillus-veneris]|uniref:Uncharacterized protein n=1 Tax=Adiantum capillus-veneris TaxID=13818 RepID=A0A9D4Z8R1_ADICA|nr:hypothetical protein GOP47_0019715 [Adiantum capillus-veneris]